jgi:hypothetical protein
MNEPSALPTPAENPTCTYIEEGYSMMRTEAPKDLVGRGLENLARTTPELPGVKSQSWLEQDTTRRIRVITVRTGNLAPDDADLGTADLLLALVDVGNLLSEVEAIFQC